MQLMKRFKKKKKVMAVLTINEVIDASPERYGKKGGTLGMLDFLYNYLDEGERIDGLLLRMNTPGGTAGASEELAQLLARLKDERKIPVVATIADICCSGGYMIACVADTIYSNKGSMTGSIGCIMQIPNIEGLSEKIGVTYVTIKSGRMKDIGNPTRKMTDEERTYLESFAKETHDAFIAHVTRHRPQIKNTEEMFDGRPVGAVLAKENDLIDAFGGYYDAYEDLLHRMGEDDDKNIEVHEFKRKKSFVQKLMGTIAPFSTENIWQGLTETRLLAK